jgi:hypothetical protein
MSDHEMPPTPDLPPAAVAELEESHEKAHAAVKRPETSDHKPKAKKQPKAKVKTVYETDKTGKNVLDEAGHKVPIGREVTLHGVTVTVLDTALGDFEIVDGLSLMQEAFEEAQAKGDDADEGLMEAAADRVSPLLRRLVGYTGSSAVIRALRREADGKLDFEHVVGFIGDLMVALSPNS